MDVFTAATLVLAHYTVWSFDNFAVCTIWRNANVTKTLFAMFAWHQIVQISGNYAILMINMKLFDICKLMQKQPKYAKSRMIWQALTTSSCSRTNVRRNT